MGQRSDTAKAEPQARSARAERTSSILQAAVAIDPPPRGALGIRDLLDLLEREITRDFPKDAGDRPAAAPRTRRASRKRA